MDANDVFNQALAHGVSFSIENDALTVDKAHKSIPEALSELIVQNESHIVSKLRRINTAKNISEIPIESKKNSKQGVMSVGQERLWYLDKLYKNKYIYNHQTGMYIEGELAIDVLTKSIKHVLENNSILRTNLRETSNGDLIQTIDDVSDSNLQIVEIKKDAAENKNVESQIDDFCLRTGQQAFSLSEDKLVRFHLVKLTDSFFYFLITMHHSITDGWSFSILSDEIWEAYQKVLKGEPLQEKSGIQYIDFSYWQKALLNSTIFDKQIRYWKDKLSNIPTSPTLAPDITLTQEKRFTGCTEFFTVTEALTAKLKQLCVSEKIIPPIALVSALYTTLMVVTGKSDIIFGVPTSNRHHPQLQKLIGFLINIVAIRISSLPSDSFRNLLSQTMKTFLEAYKNQDIPFDEVVKKINPHRNINTSPIFQIIFSYQNIPMGDKYLSDDFYIGPLREHRVGAAKYDLNISIKEKDSKLEGFIEYNNELFLPSTIKSIINKFFDFLDIATTTPELPLSHLYKNSGETVTPISQYEAHRINEPKISVINMFERQAHLAPNAVAIFHEGKKLTYKELNEIANRYANYFSEHGVNSNVMVGLHARMSPSIAAVMIAVLKCGAAYVPIDIDQPISRKKKIIDEANIKFIVKAHEVGTGLPLSEEIVLFDIADDKVALLKKSVHFTNKAAIDSLAYVMYTSGTTGVPKGVMISHLSLSNMAKAYSSTLRLDAESRVLQYAPICFDVSVSDIFSSLTAGASIFITSALETHPGKQLMNYIEENHISDIHLTPSIFSFLAESDYPHLRNIVLGGEPFSYNLIENWIDKCRVFNSYGATETTVSIALSQLNSETDKIMIGKPIDNCEIYLLDPNENPVAVGQIGEVYVAGHCLARGYLNDSKENSLKFITNPFTNTSPFKTLYRTGDFARKVDASHIQFVSRKDGQVKIGGRRIELSEISTVIESHSDVLSSVVIPYDKGGANKILIAYYVAKSVGSLSCELKQLLHRNLPAYMIPQQFIKLDKFPYNQNGKIDLAALPDPNFNDIDKSWHDNPRSQREYELMNMWKELLCLDSIRINDSFFELGGHSLLSLKLLSSIENKYGNEIPLSEFIQNPTISYLAHKLESGNVQMNSWSPIIKLQPDGDKSPIFCVHPAGGTVFCYADLATQLRKFDYPLYGIQAQGLEAKQSLICSTEDMAALYLENILKAYPQGPYYLLGWSAGGTIAYEIAQQMVEKDVDIRFLGLIDTYAHLSQNTRIQNINLDDDIELLARIYLNSSPYEQLPVAISRELNELSSDHEKLIFIVNRSKKMGLLHPAISNNKALRLLKAFKNDCNAVRRYSPKPYPKDIVVFKAKEKLRVEANKPYALGWGDISGNKVSVHDTPGNHMNMLYYPNVVSLAATINKGIQNLTCLT